MSRQPHSAHSHVRRGFGPLSVEESELLKKLDLSRLPRHVAIIMDGNGRGPAQASSAHCRAPFRTKTARIATETCARLNIEALTLYAFSVENWRRPKAETDFLMQLLREYIRKEMPLIQKNDIRMRFLGRIHELPVGVQNDVREATERTAKNTGMVMCVALNYGGRAEIVDALNAILTERNLPVTPVHTGSDLRASNPAEQAASNGSHQSATTSANLSVHSGSDLRTFGSAEQSAPNGSHLSAPASSANRSHNFAARITEHDLSRHLYTSGLPDPDLLIRTSGELRVSNFLLWQIAYAEIVVTETLWPDFNRACLLEALIEFQKRERRYGGINQPAHASDSAALRHDEETISARTAASPHSGADSLATTHPRTILLNPSTSPTNPIASPANN